MLLISAVQQNESAVCIHISPRLEPRSQAPAHPSAITGLHAEPLVVYSRSPLAVCAAQADELMSVLLPGLITPAPSPTGPPIHSLPLRLYSCPANRLTDTMFLDPADRR